MFFGTFIILFISLVNGYPSDINNDQCINYCSNDAVCLTVNNKPQCYCLPEWEGEFCDIIRQPQTNENISQIKQISRNNLRNVPCDSAPADLCKNGGFCYSNNNKLACQCPYPYSGTRCAEYSLCYNYCLNGGTCEEDKAATPPIPKCECGETKFTGMRCQLIATTTSVGTPTTTTDVRCTYLPDGYCTVGICVVIGGKTACQCPPTHTGDQCQTRIGESQVTSNPGQQTPPPVIPGGVTTPNSGSGNGLTCANNPCKNGRPCYNNGNTYFCFCGPQFTGTNCESNG